MSTSCTLSHDKNEPLGVQDSRFQNMHRPAHVTARIKEQQRMALAGVRGRQPDKALLGFYASMEHLCSVAGPFLNHINLSAIITATAQLWTSAQANSSFKPSAYTAGIEMKRFYCSVLVWLQPMVPDIEARQISNVLWSSAKLGLSPDAAVPGMTDALAAKLLQLAKDEARHQPNAQSCANFLWALATLGHYPADQGLVDAVFDLFVMLFKHRDAQKQPSSQGVSTVLWALGELNHAPPDGAASAILEWLIRLCKLPGQQPNAQDLSNTLFACAVLRLNVRGHVSLALVDELLSLDRSSGYRQQFCNAAWSLAVSGLLSFEIFHALLERLQPLPTAEAAHEALPRQGLRQLYQAWDSLQPFPSVAAQQLQEMLNSLGQRPLPDPQQAAVSSASRQLSLALGQLGLAFAPDVPLSGYWVNAVLHPRDGVTDPIVMATEFLHCFKNDNDRYVHYYIECQALHLHFLCGCSCLRCMPFIQIHPHSVYELAVALQRMA